MSYIIEVKRLELDDFSRPRLQNIKTKMIYANIDLSDDLLSPNWHTTSKDGEPEYPLRADKEFKLI